MSLTFIAVVLPAFAGISLCLGLGHLAVWIKETRQLAHAALLLMGLSIAVILVIELMLMQAEKPAEYATIMRWRWLPVFAFIASSILLLRTRYGARRAWLGYTALALLWLVVTVNFLVQPNLNYRAAMYPAIWEGGKTFVAENPSRILALLDTLSALLVLLFFLDASIAGWRQGDRVERRRIAITGGSLVLVATAMVGSPVLCRGLVSHRLYLLAGFSLVIAAIGNELRGGLVSRATLARQREKSAADLRKSERRMDLASAAAGVGAWEWDFERDEVWASDQTRLLYGMNLKESITFSRFLTALHEDDRDAVRESVLQSLRDGLRFQREYRVRGADDRVRWVATRGRVESCANSDRAVMRGISWDISERRTADERFREVVEAVPISMLITGVDGRIVLANTQVEADFGYSRDELIGKFAGLLIPACFRSDRSGRQLLFSAPLSSWSMGGERSVVGRRKNGSEMPMEVKLTPIHSDHGLEVLASITDVSDRRRREELLQQEREFLRQVIDINPGLIFAKDRAGRFTLANEAVARIYGTTVNDLIGKTDFDFNPKTEEVHAFRKADMEVMDSLNKKFIFEESITDADGKVHWLQTVKLPVLDKDGVADQLLGTATDITERKKADLDLAQQRNELAHLSRVMMLSELSGSLAHELNQPLTAILTNAQAALRFLDGDSPNLDEIREILRDIVSDDRRAGEVIQGLRQLLKKEEMRRVPLDPNTLVESVIKLLRSDMLNAGVAYSTECAQDLPRICGIAVQLQQVLLNLMVNGCDAMAVVPGPERTLVISTESSSNGVVKFCVRDQGPGIASQHADQVFEPFFTTKAHGLGLGLAVCRKLIEAHGGHIWAVSNEGRGASFCFTVPKAMEDTA